MAQRKATMAYRYGGFVGMAFQQTSMSLKQTVWDGVCLALCLLGGDSLLAYVTPAVVCSDWRCFALLAAPACHFNRPQHTALNRCQ
ncbi:hypothetical protein [Alkalilimnicola ehrlichii]|uniref:hypothetical protein n=1 Tax=Alkalilimnicola ehrlichii TaxID=351052 RepID=UPI0011C02902|nr:hypothetical protein [Alkalilimnicola ehrlichii]